jgi:hypothetical protein
LPVNIGKIDIVLSLRLQDINERRVDVRPPTDCAAA